MNKLLISLLSLTGISGISTGGYFLLRNGSENVEDSKPTAGEQRSGGGGGEEASVSGVGAAEANAASSAPGQDVQSQQSLPPSQPPSGKKEE